jgi:hypothetical protein
MDIKTEDGKLIQAVTQVDSAGVSVTDIRIFTLLDGATATGAGSVVAIPRGNRAFRADMAGTGAVTATVEVYGNTADSTIGGHLIDTLSLSGTTTAFDTGVDVYPWPYVYADVTDITGTDATLTLTLAV